VSPTLPPATAFDMQLGFGVGSGFCGTLLDLRGLAFLFAP
jgi:hypothetical protein